MLYKYKRLEKAAREEEKRKKKNKHRTWDEEEPIETRVCMCYVLWLVLACVCRSIRLAEEKKNERFIRQPKACDIPSYYAKLGDVNIMPDI